MPAGLDHNLTCVALSTSCHQSPQMQRLVPETSGFEALSRPAGKVRCTRSFALRAQESTPPEALQEVLWKQFCADTTERWDDSQSKPTSRHPDFRQRECKIPLWLNNRLKPGWVNSQLATMHAGMKTTSESSSPSVQGPGAFAAIEGHLEVNMCRKQCEDGLISDAVVALDLLVQRGRHVPNNLFYRVLKRCIKDKDLVLGRHVHDLSVKSGYEGDAFLATHLISFYASHSRLEEAMAVFSKVYTPNAYNWATIIFAYARHGEAAEAIRLYRLMWESSSVEPDDRIYSAVLKACTAAGDLVTGKEVHAHILASPRKPDRFVQAGLVNMYAKCGSLEDARKVFDNLSDRDVVTWTAMIAGYTQHRMGAEALRLYNSMQQEGFTPPDCVTYACLLQACASVGVGALAEGRQLHAQIKKQRLQVDLVLGGSLVKMYAKCGSLEDACIVFNKLAERDVVTWTVMIAVYAQQGMGQEALSLYRSMQQKGPTAPDCVTYVSLLQACASVGGRALDEGKQLHAQIKERGLQEDAVLGGSLVNMYAKCGSMEDAGSIFAKLPERNIEAYNAMISGYAQHGMGEEALHFYCSMQQHGLPPNSVTYVCLLQACASLGEGALHDGKQLHAEIKEHGLQEDVGIGGSLVNMYAKCGSLEDARIVFDKLSERNVITWTGMIAGYAQQGMGQEALDIYRNMQQEGLSPNSVTFVCVLQACASVGVGALDEGKQLHAQIKERRLQEDVVLGGSLVNMYAKCGSLEDARALFDKLSERNVVAWTAMIAGYAQQGMGQEALSLYRRMQLEGFAPNSITYLCLLQACAAVAALPLGEQLHAEIKERGMQVDDVVGAALVNMYAKCGNMFDSQQVFDSLPERSVEAWGALVSGYARQGDSKVVFDLLDRMRLEGMKPNEVVFLSVLTVCSHVGLVDKGREYFKAMWTDYGISATVDHFICMVDLLGRAGHLDEALQMAKTMPFPPNDVVWHTLLGACWKWRNVGIGQQAFNCAVSVDERDAASYVLMSNIYASAGMWEAAMEMQARRMILGAWKTPGQSWWTDMDGVVHTFLVGDKNHPVNEIIYASLEQLVTK